MNIGQAAVNTVVPNGESLVVDAQLVKQRGMDVVNLGGAFTIQRLIAPFVRGPIADPPFDSTTA